MNKVRAEISYFISSKVFASVFNYSFAHIFGWFNSFYCCLYFTKLDLKIFTTRVISHQVKSAVNIDHPHSEKRHLALSIAIEVFWRLLLFSLYRINHFLSSIILSCRVFISKSAVSWCCLVALIKVPPSYPSLINCEGVKQFVCESQNWYFLRIQTHKFIKVNETK